MVTQGSVNGALSVRLDDPALSKIIINHNPQKRGQKMSRRIGKWPFQNRFTSLSNQLVFLNNTCIRC